MVEDDNWSKVYDELQVARGLYDQLKKRLAHMKANAAPKLKYKSLDLAEKIVVGCCYAEQMGFISRSNVLPQTATVNDDDGRRQLREELPTAQHLCKQLCDMLPYLKAAVPPHAKEHGAAVALRLSLFHSRAQQIGLIISDIVQSLHPEQGGAGGCKDALMTTSRSEGSDMGEDDQRVSKRLKTDQKQEDVCDDAYEAKLRSDIVSPNDIGVTFDDIGALEETKKLIHELVILPLKRPELFKGGLLKPCKGILLFGPPGTGKTMLAKAIARESGANFINASLSSIFCQWMGESEKNVKALFTLAAKVAPTVIFVDEVDSLLGRRTSNEYDTAYRKVKNEFMSLWDGLRTKSGKQILVLGATNRPFDLDEAIVRRFEQRILVNLPCENSRESILKKLLAKEDVESMDFKELAIMTEGYTGSDLKNLCTTAAYQPLRELLEQERLAPMDESQNTIEVPFLRPLNMDDLKQAREEVAPSFSADGPSRLELEKWNNLYGRGSKKNRMDAGRTCPGARPVKVTSTPPPPSTLRSGRVYRGGT